MPETQAFSVSWTVTIQPEGDVSEDVAEITIIEEDGKPDAATVTLDTSEQPHALEEQRDISITLTDQNDTVTFEGYTDSVSDDPEDPVVTVDSRESDGLLQDATAAGSIDEPNLFQVIDALVDRTPGQVREISFDPIPLELSFGTFQGTTNFAHINIAYSGSYGTTEETIDNRETSSRGKEVELRFDWYRNTTNTTYQMDIIGADSSNTEVTATLDLPPAESAQEAFGSDTVPLALSGGDELITRTASISTNIPALDNDEAVTVGGDIYPYVKTSWNFDVSNAVSVEDAVSRIVSYISGRDANRSWEHYVTDSDELIVQPESDGNPDRYVFREADNVMKPVASRDLDGVRNFIKVSGDGPVNVWLWSYGGDLQWAIGNPFDSGNYPTGGVDYASSHAPENDIDSINLRAESLSSDTIGGYDQAVDIGKKALEEYLRTPVSGQAPVPGIHPASPGDEAEVYYPSRGIPAKVSDNVYRIKKVEYTVTPHQAKTTVDFGSSRRNVGDIINSGGSLQRNDISDDVTQIVDRPAPGGGGDSDSDALLVVGELDSQNDDGTWTVKGEDGETYENVRVI